MDSDIVHCFFRLKSIFQWSVILYSITYLLTHDSFLLFYLLIGSSPYIQNSARLRLIGRLALCRLVLSSLDILSIQLHQDLKYRDTINNICSLASWVINISYWYNNKGKHLIHMYMHVTIYKADITKAQQADT